MTISALDLKKMNLEFRRNGISGHPVFLFQDKKSTTTAAAPPSGQELASRLEGLLTGDHIDELARSISLDCEREND